jgi:hypothetical protein
MGRNSTNYKLLEVEGRYKPFFFFSSKGRFFVSNGPLPWFWGFFNLSGLWISFFCQSRLF